MGNNRAIQPSNGRFIYRGIYQIQYSKAYIPNSGDFLKINIKNIFLAIAVLALVSFRGQ
jgi:hypothetical protein